MVAVTRGYYTLLSHAPELHFIFECLLADPLIDNPPVVTGDTRQNLRVCFFPGLS